jgi:hypothetical protein
MVSSVRLTRLMVSQSAALAGERRTGSGAPSAGPAASCGRELNIRLTWPMSFSMNES